MNHMEKTDPSVHFTAGHVVRVLRRRIVVIVLALVGVPVAALAFSLLQEQKYTASSSLLFRDPELAEQLFQSNSFKPSTDPEREAGTNLQLVSLDVVAERTAKTLGGVSGDEVSDKVEIGSEGASDVVSIRATETEPALAARLANVFATEYVDFRREADRSKVGEAQRLVEVKLNSLSRSDKNGSRGRALENRSEQLGLLAALQTGNAEVVQQAEPPSSPSSPQTARNTAVGVALGLLLGLALAGLLELFDRRLKDPGEIEAIFARPLLGTIPESRMLSGRTDTPERLPPTEAEAFRMLRSNLRYFNVDHDHRSVMVTSTSAGEGKSTVAWNLAAATAEAGSRVLLLEADLRRPSLAERHGVAGGAGLSGVLTGEARLDQVALSIPLDRPTFNGTRSYFDVLLAGPTPPNPSDLIESEHMSDLMRSAKDTYDMVVIDTPPATVVSDAAPLVKQVSGVMVVVRLGTVTRESARHLQRQLDHLEAPTLGVVINGVGTRGSYSSGYGYYGSAGYEPTEYAAAASALQTRPDRAEETGSPLGDGSGKGSGAATGDETARVTATSEEPPSVTGGPMATAEQAPPRTTNAETPAAEASRERELATNGASSSSYTDGHRGRPRGQRARERLRSLLRP